MFVLYNLITFAPLALILHCLFIFLFNRWLGPIGTFYGSLLTFSSVLIVSLMELYQVLIHGYSTYVDFGRWFFCIDLVDSHFVFCIDSLALIASSLVLTLTMFALYFGVEYMYSEAFINSLLYLLNLFATSVVFLFYCYDYFLILFSWECIGLFSFLLVNFYSTRIYSVKAAFKTFVFSSISDMFMFFSFLLTINTYNTTDLSLIFTQTPFLTFHYVFFGDTAVHFITLFSFSLVTSGAINAAQFFFHVWLPDAMEAPTPASALIHSSTLVVAGVFLVIRFSVLFEFTVFTNYYLAIFGALTLSFGAITATFQNDIKKLVAYSTISQIGYLVCGCGFCCYEEVLIYLIIHALNNAFLFVLVGYTVHFFSGNTDMRQMGGAYLYSFDIAVLLTGVCFNLAGLPYTAGFLGNEFLLFQVLSDDFLSLFVSGCWLVSFFFTPIYMFMLVFLVMFGPKNGSIVAYSPNWDFNYFNQLVLLNKTNSASHNFSTLTYAFNFQFTCVTSSLTTYFLFSFWAFFFFFGELLLLVILNYVSTIDAISGNSFTVINQHMIFYILTIPVNLSTHINTYIYFLTSCSFFYMINFTYSYSYRYLSLSSINNFLINSLFIISIVYGFVSSSLILVLFFLLLNATMVN